ncbi:MAG: AgmX/PglI C-terminal domain-containing protein [Deltaproteobacteria bacterium]|nr:AgmX/PglI C-terminal domain-containing protein [Deltaproteobacteria bacterium]
MRSLALVLLVACGGGGSAEPAPGSAEDEPRPPAKPPAHVEGVDLPEVDALGYAPTDVKAPLVTVARTAVAVAGKQVVRLSDGTFLAEDLEAPHSRIVPKLRDALANVAGDAPRPPLVLALDRTATYATMVQVMYVAKQKEAGWTTFSLLATSGGKLVALPVALPDKAPSAITVANAGKLDATPDGFRAKLESAYAPEIKKCYTAALARDKTLGGKVILEFTVTLDGAVKDARARGFDKGFDGCIARLMPAWRFPKPEAVTQVHFPMRFTSADTVVTKDPRPDAELIRKLAALEGPMFLESRDRALVREQLRMVVSVQKDDILVWSLTGREGTLAAPKARFPRGDEASVAQVRDALAEIVKRYDNHKPREPSTRAALFMADPSVPVALVAKLLGAMRGGEGDAAIFPDVQLSLGFE